jgi:hypothetical protein
MDRQQVVAPLDTPGTSLYLQWLLHDASAFEVCHMDGGARSAWFSEADRALAWAGQRAEAGNLFTTLHRLNMDAVLAYREGNPNGRTRDEHVVRFCRIFLDLVVFKNCCQP